MRFIIFATNIGTIENDFKSGSRKEIFIRNMPFITCINWLCKFAHIEAQNVLDLEGAIQMIQLCSWKSNKHELEKLNHFYLVAHIW